MAHGVIAEIAQVHKQWSLSYSAVVLLGKSFSKQCTWVHCSKEQVQGTVPCECVAAVYSGMNLYFQKVKKTYRPLTTYTREAKNGEAGAFTADLDSAEEV